MLQYLEQVFNSSESTRVGLFLTFIYKMCRWCINMSYRRTHTAVKHVLCWW